MLWKKSRREIAFCEQHWIVTPRVSIIQISFQTQPIPQVNRVKDLGFSVAQYTPAAIRVQRSGELLVITKSSVGALSSKIQSWVISTLKSIDHGFHYPSLLSEPFTCEAPT